jgi:hypothetical protein
MLALQQRGVRVVAREPLRSFVAAVDGVQLKRCLFRCYGERRSLLAPKLTQGEQRSSFHAPFRAASADISLVPPRDTP